LSWHGLSWHGWVRCGDGPDLFHRCFYDRQSRVAVEYRVLQPAQLLARLDAEMLGELPPRRVVRRERPFDVAGHVPSADQQRVRPLAQRLGRQ
jgi:hypothetical protein